NNYTKEDVFEEKTMGHEPQKREKSDLHMGEDKLSMEDQFLDKNEDQELAGIPKAAARWRQIEGIHDHGENYEEVPCIGNLRYDDILPSFIPLPYSHHDEGFFKEASDKCIVKASTRKTKEHGGKEILEFGLHADLNSEFLSIVGSILSIRGGTHHPPWVKSLLHDQRDTMLIDKGSRHQLIGEELPRRMEPNKARTRKKHRA
ncbi:hypothetical protein KI387_042244, partial [Taxus chinensis]